MTKLLGTAYMNSARTGVCTTIVKVDYGYGVEYRFISVPNATDPEADIKMAIQWGSRLDDEVGELLIENTGSQYNKETTAVKLNGRKQTINLRHNNEA